MDRAASLLEAVGSFFPILPVYSALESRVNFSLSSRSTGPLDSANWKDCVSLGNDKQFHGVWDIPLTGHGDWRLQSDPLIRERTDSPPVLDPQDANSIRLTIREAHEDGAAFDNKDAPGFTALSSQWRKDVPYPRYHIKTYETCSPVRVLRSIQVIEDQHHRRYVRVVCQSFLVRSVKERLDEKPSGFQFFTSARFSLELKALDDNYRLIRSSDNWKQAFLLQFHHACLRLFADFLASLVLQDDIDPTWAELRRWTLKEITKHSCECLSLRQMSQDLISTTESLIDVVKASVTVSGASQASQATAQFMAIEAELRGCCRESGERLQKLSDGLEHNLKFLELARNMNQTLSVQQLTLLATIFLPLSLAAGVLSMQTRFKNLGILLYDFFGVAALLGAIIAIILILLAIIAIGREVESKLSAQTPFYRKHIRLIFKTILMLLFVQCGGLVVASFAVGMFVDLDFGVRLLYTAFGGAFMYTLAYTAPVFVIICLWIWPRSTVNDPEDRAASLDRQAEILATEPETLKDIARVHI